MDVSFILPLLLLELRLQLLASYYVVFNISVYAKVDHAALRHMVSFPYTFQYWLVRRNC